jgi:hypothetical protein
MAVGEAGSNRMKAAAPYIGAGAAIAIVVGVAATLNSGEKSAAPSSSATPIEASVAESVDAPIAAAAPQIPQPGASVPGVAQAPATVTRPGAAAPQMGMEIVVKFKDDAKVKDIIDTFWKDQASARAKFDALKARRPEFADLKLDRVTYSNELVLVDTSTAPAAQRLPAMRGIAAKLKDVSDLSYAEPNMTAHPGGQ